MHPVLFETTMFGRELSVKSYTFFVVLAALGFVWLAGEIARGCVLDRRRSTLCLFVGILTAAVGARLVHWLTNPDSFESIRDIVSLDRTNLSAYAGILLEIPAVWFVARRLNVDRLILADAAAPALAVAIAVARIGCFLNGCCFGVSCGLPWATRVEVGSEAHLAQVESGQIGLFDSPEPVHPTQLYDAGAALIAGLLAVLMLARSQGRGRAFPLFLLCYTALRWSFAGLLYDPPSFAVPKWLYAALYMVVIAVCAVCLLTRRRVKKAGSGTYGAQETS